jgi:peptidoglycan/LPS O-acetylase OafA/YrhL
VFVIVSLVFGEIKSRMLALAVICVSCASVWPYIDLRDKATPRILATRSPEFAPLIQQQTQRRKDWSWPYYAMTLFSGIALLSARSPKGRPVLFFVIIFGALLFWFSIWLHKKECEVYHRNIVRFVPVR